MTQNPNDNHKPWFEQALDEIMKEELKHLHPEEAMFPEEEEEELPEVAFQAAMEEYIPVSDEEWEEFISSPPLPPLNREQEASAVSLGLQEIRKMREYMLYVYRHMNSEFVRIYATYPFLNDSFDNEFASVHQRLISQMEDMENLIAGDLDLIKVVQEDCRLRPTFEEKRLRILHSILDFYDDPEV